MTSLFDSVGAPSELPVDLMSRGKRGVELLEFMAVGARAVADAAAVAEAGSVAEEEQAEVVLERERGVQLRVMLEAAREDAAMEARRLAVLEFEGRVKEERRGVERLMADFGEQRQGYFAKAEVAVVRLALSIAAKVLQREVLGDPMHLTSTVRAALSRIHDGSLAVMRVRPEEVEGWQRVFAEDGAGQIEVTGDKELRAGDCVLETTIGRVDLGAAAQLGEIERGFRELLERGGS
jgi:flagellar assembly protein FliH